MSETGKDELFKVGGGTSGVNVESITRPRRISLAPCSNAVFSIEVSCPLKAITPSTEVAMGEEKTDAQSCLFQQRISKVKRHTADISKQLDKLNVLSDLPNDNGSE